MTGAKKKTGAPPSTPKHGRCPREVLSRSRMSRNDSSPVL